MRANILGIDCIEITITSALLNDKFNCYAYAFISTIMFIVEEQFVNIEDMYHIFLAVRVYQIGKKIREIVIADFIRSQHTLALVI